MSLVAAAAKPAFRSLVLCRSSSLSSASQTQSSDKALSCWSKKEGKLPKRAGRQFRKVVMASPMIEMVSKPAAVVVSVIRRLMLSKLYSMLPWLYWRVATHLIPCKVDSTVRFVLEMPCWRRRVEVNERGSNDFSAIRGDASKCARRVFKKHGVKAFWRVIIQHYIIYL